MRDVRYFFKDARMLFGRDAVMDTVRTLRTDVFHLAADVQIGIKAPLLGALILSDGVSRNGNRRVPLASLIGLPPNRLVIISNLSSLPRALHPGLPYVFAANGSEGMIIRGSSFCGQESLQRILLHGSPDWSVAGGGLSHSATADDRG
jgi:hypothetical protein